MACPHVSGIMALCYAAGACRSETGTEYETGALQPAIAHSTASPAYGFNSDPITNPQPDKYYGYLAWARRWWAPRG
jgi:hypothetical protein